MSRCMRVSHALLTGAIALGLASGVRAAGLAEARIYIEYNSSANDLGFHVSLDGEDWTALQIVDPAGTAIFAVEGKGAYKDLGLTELFFEGAEPSLDDVPLQQLLARFPEGRYRFIATRVDGARLLSAATLTHSVPAGPSVAADLDGDSLVIRWQPVTGPPPGFPVERIEIVGYQVIVEPFQVTLPSSSRQVTVPREFVQSLPRGTHAFEVLAIEKGGNQTITEGSFEIP